MPTPWHLLDSTATLYPATQSQDAAYAPTSTFAAAATTILCRLRPLTSEEAMQYDRETATNTYKVWFAPINSAGTALTSASITHDMQLKVDTTQYMVVGNAQEIRGFGNTIERLEATVMRGVPVL